MRRSPAAGADRSRAACAATALARFGATAAGTEPGESSAVGEYTAGCGLPSPITSAVAPAAPAPMAGDAPPSQERKRCGAAAISADSATVRRPR